MQTECNAFKMAIWQFRQWNSKFNFPKQNRINVRGYVTISALFFLYTLCWIVRMENGNSWDFTVSRICVTMQTLFRFALFYANY